MKVPSIYVGATAQHGGKTTVTLGLLHACKSRGLDVGFMKPVGQTHIELRGRRVDKDVALAELVLGTKSLDPALLSPVIVPSGFTQTYLQNRNPQLLHQRIVEAGQILSEEHAFLVAEGTGHAGVGACFDLSNAQVASLLSSKVVMVCEGGIGRPLDEIALNLALYRAHNVEVIGVIANKVFPGKLEQIRQMLMLGLQHQNTELLGCIPYYPELTYPTMAQIVNLFDAEILCNADKLGQHAERYVVAAMEPEHAIEYVFSRSLVIMPGDRVDNMLITMGSFLVDSDGPTPTVSGILLTGGLRPPASIVSLLERAGLPVVLVNDDTFEAASKLWKTVFKIQPSDAYKIASAEKLVSDYVDIDRILEKSGCSRSAR